MKFWFLPKKIFSLAIVIVCSFGLTGCEMPFQKQAPAGLQVSTEGTTASVFLNGEFVNKTPYVDKNLSPGRYSLRIEPDDASLAAHETSVLLTGGALTVFNWTFGPTVETSGGVLFEMEKISHNDRASLLISSIPDGTIVKLNNESRGFTPVLIDEIQAGSHRLNVTLPSYVEQQRTVNVINGFQMNVTVKLAKEMASLDRISQLQASTSSEISTDSADLNSTSSDDKVDSSTNSASLSNNLEKPFVVIQETGTGWLRVRSQASASSEELAKIDVGESFAFLQAADGWYQIEYEKGKNGWISGQYAKLVE